MGDGERRSADGPAELALVTGLSGSGKSTVAKSFEDLGYHVVDNLPLGLLRQFLATPEAAAGLRRIAVVADVRAPGFAAEVPRLLAEIPPGALGVTVVFVEAADEALIRRFSETRRPHPLAAEGSVIEGIRRERELLADIRALADLVFDTSDWSIHETRHQVFSLFGEGADQGHRLIVALVSFGFKFGVPYGSDLLFDVRFLTNPHFVPGLRERTGRDKEVLCFLDDRTEFIEAVRRMGEYLLWVLPRYEREHRRYAAVAVGCTGGRHRSVAAAERLQQVLDTEGWPVRLVHRDIER